MGISFGDDFSMGWAGGWEGKDTVLGDSQALTD